MANPRWSTSSCACTTTQSGRVLVDGRDIRDYTLESFRSQIGVVLQDTLLFAATVRENIGYGAADATPEEIEARHDWPTPTSS